MAESIELRLTNLAQKVAEMYKDRITPEQYKQLCNAIHVCRDYHVNSQREWVDMYDVVLYDGGIWEYSYSPEFTEELQDMWTLEMNILSCNCYLGCGDDTPPQDLELQGDNIPEYVDFLESIIGENMDYEKIFEFWGEKICY